MAYEFPKCGFDVVARELCVLGVLSDCGLGVLGEATPLCLLGVPPGALLVGPVPWRDRALGVVGVRELLLELEELRVRVVGSLLVGDQVVWEFDSHDG